jgi:hypothetical protein
VITGEVNGENAAAQFGSPVEAYAEVARSPREDKKRPAGSTAADEEIPSHKNPTIVVAEQWLCFLLGFICMVCGGWGICMKYSLDLSSGYISWLGSAYGPALRFTAVACLVSGAVLLRRGLARPDVGTVALTLVDAVWLSRRSVRQRL